MEGSSSYVSTFSGSSSSQSAAKGQPRAKRGWKADEDALLVACLTDLVREGKWKAENGFRTGYLIQLEKQMDVALPHAGIKATPHIESRLKTMRRQTMAITEMLQVGSGFNWSDETKSLVCEKSVFDDWCKSHPAASGLRLKCFPHYDALADAFGKDRASGGTSHTLRQAQIDLNTTLDPLAEANLGFFGTFIETVESGDPTMHDMRTVLDEMEADDDTTSPDVFVFGGTPAGMSTTMPSSFTTPAQSRTPPVVAGTTPTSTSLFESSRSSGTRKRSRRTADCPEFMASFAKYVDLTEKSMIQSQEHMSAIRESLLQDTRHGLKREQATTDIMSLPGLTADQREDACEMLSEQQVEVYLKLPDDRKVPWVCKILHRAQH